MTIYTFQIFGYGANPEASSGGGVTTVSPGAQPIAVSVNDNDTVLNEV
ncbi:hypothetical protein NX862_04725 [Rhodobacter sp. KR11]|nr:hypothetical protein [Rhodobacter sp. KR11]MCW1918049.1 hypothetical protein [Rhodobacter sp. KR11]